jgi:hypothetical protein
VSLSPVICNLPVLAIDTTYFHRDEAAKVDNAQGKPRPVVPTLNSHRMLIYTMHRSRLPMQGRVA